MSDHADAAWHEPERWQSLAADRLDVWRVALDPAHEHPRTVAELTATLSDEERARAVRFHFEHDRNAYIITRATLRMLLGRALSLPASKLQFAYGPQGKPSLIAPAGPRAAALPSFNVSHSGDWALIALTLARDVGVDIEKHRTRADDDRIPERFFSAAESAALRTVPREQRDAAFYACWSRKEAYIKARGGGLSIPLDAFDVALAPDEPAALLQVRPEARDTQTWRLIALDPDPHYSAALVAEDGAWSVAQHAWPGAAKFELLKS